MYSVTIYDPVPLTLLDVDVLATATARSLVYHNASGMPSASVELRVTLLGASPVNLTVRMLAQDTPPALETTRLLVPSVAIPVPDTSALVADYAGVFLIPVYTEYGQVEVVNVSGGNVHVKLTISGSQATAAGVSGSSAASHVVVDTLPKVDLAVYAPWVDTVSSADTAAHAYATSKVLKTPVFVRAQRTMTGTVTIGDGVNVGMVLTAGDAMPWHGTNLNQLTYQFSINASATEKFSVSAGV